MKNRTVPLNSLLRQAATIASLLCHRGWAERNAGNFSVRLPGKPSAFPTFPKKKIFSGTLPEALPELISDWFYVTVSGSRMRDLAVQPAESSLMVRLQKNGRDFQAFPLKGEAKQPTSELASHLLIHCFLKKQGALKKAILHTHPTELIALTQIPACRNKAHLNRLLLGMYAECAMFVPKGVGLLPFMLSGGLDIAKATLAELKEHDTVLWAKHGVLSVGRDLDDAFDSVDMVAKAADIFLKVKSSGHEPEGLSLDHIRALARLAAPMLLR